MKTDVIDSTVAMWTAEPEKAQGKPQVTGRLEGSQAVIEAGPFSWRADLPAPLGGSNEAPSPTQILLGALAGCAVVFVRDVLAPQLGYTVDEVEANVSCQTDARGLLGMDGTRSDLQGLKLDVKVTSPDGPDAVANIAKVWLERCPVYLAILNGTPVDVSFRC